MRGRSCPNEVYGRGRDRIEIRFLIAITRYYEIRKFKLKWVSGREY
jgi:hypothetical protein